MNKLAIIDADGLCYMSSRETLEESIQSLNDKIQNIFDKTEATHYIMFISKGRYFRHNISKDYKANRAKYPTKLKWLKTLKNYLIERWNAQSMDLVESDDLCAYWIVNGKSIHNTKYVDLVSDSGNYIQRLSTIDNTSVFIDDFEKVDVIICSPDKDVLNLQGRHFNYTYKIKDESKSKPKEALTDSDFNKGWWVETNELEAKSNFWTSMVTGDSTDGIKGIESRGIRFACTIYDCDTEMVSHQYICLREYINKYGLSQGIFNFQQNYRLLHMLDCDEDFMRECNKTPEFPTISEVPKVIVEPVIEF